MYVEHEDLYADEIKMIWDDIFYNPFRETADYGKLYLDDLNNSIFNRTNSLASNASQNSIKGIIDSIDKVIFSGNCTIIIDKTHNKKTKVTYQGEKSGYNRFIGYLYAIAKHVLYVQGRSKEFSYLCRMISNYTDTIWNHLDPIYTFLVSYLTGLLGYENLFKAYDLNEERVYND